MELTTLVDILEREIGSSASARATLADMLSERGCHAEAAAQRRIARRRQAASAGVRSSASNR